MYSVTGPQVWKNKEGVTLKEIEKKESELGEYYVSNAKIKAVKDLGIPVFDWKTRFNKEHIKSLIQVKNLS